MNIKEIIPTTWIIAEDKATVKLWYSANRGNYNRKPFVFPKEIKFTVEFAEFMGMILGDGDVHRMEKRHFTYASKDVDLSLFVWNFLRDILLVDVKDITFTVKYRYIDPQLKNLALNLNIDKKNIHSTFSLRHNYPALHIQVNGAVFRVVFERIIDTFVKSDFLEDSKLRQGFLRGIFAAEGCVGIQYDEYYINQLELTLSAKEQELMKFIQRALSLEKIDFKITVKNNTISINILNWKNYLKCWQIRLFDRCSRKKETFLSVARESKVYAVIDSSDLKKLSEGFTQKELAKIIGSWQGNVCRVLQGKFLLNLRQIQVLKNHSINLQIKNIRIGNLTELPWNDDTRELFSPEKIKNKEWRD